MQRHIGATILALAGTACCAAFGQRWWQSCAIGTLFLWSGWRIGFKHGAKEMLDAVLRQFTTRKDG